MCTNNTGFRSSKSTKNANALFKILAKKYMDNHKLYYNNIKKNQALKKNI